MNNKIVIFWSFFITLLIGLANESIAQRFVCPGSQETYNAPNCHPPLIDADVTGGTASYSNSGRTVTITWDSTPIGQAIITYGCDDGRPGRTIDVRKIIVNSITVDCDDNILGNGQNPIVAQIIYEHGYVNPSPNVSWAIYSDVSQDNLITELFETGENINFTPDNYYSDLENYYGNNVFISTTITICGVSTTSPSKQIALLPNPYEVTGDNTSQTIRTTCLNSSDGILEISSLELNGQPINGDIPGVGVFIEVTGDDNNGNYPAGEIVNTLPHTIELGPNDPAYPYKYVVERIINGVRSGIHDGEHSFNVESGPSLSLNPTPTTPDCHNSTSTITLSVDDEGNNYSYTFYQIDENDIETALTGNTADISDADNNGTEDYSFRAEVTDFNSCEASANGSVDFPSAVSNVSHVSTDIHCHDSTATITASASGGNGTYNFSVTESTGASWSGNNPYVCYPGNYTITATDGNGCPDDTMIVISNHDPISITAQIDNHPANCNPEEGQISVYASNVYVDNNPMTGVLFNLVELDEFDNETTVDNQVGYSPGWSETFTPSPGRYKIRASHSCHDTDESAIFVINPAIHPLITTADTSITDAACYNGNGIVTLNSFNYDGSTFNTSGNPSGFDYYINGEEVFTDGSFDYTIQHQTTEEMIVQHFSTQCESEPFEIFVNVPPQLALSPSITPSQCHDIGNITLSANVTGGVTPYSYQWTDVEAGTDLADNSSSIEVWEGIYDFRVVDANNCGLNKTVPDGTSYAERYNASRPQSLNIHIENATDADAPGANNGSVTLGTTFTESMVEYSSNGISFQPQPFFNNLTPGTHIFYIRNENLCENSVEVTINEAEAFTVGIGTTNDANCYNGADGQITINATGGFTPYTFTISGNGINRTQIDNNTFDNLPAGTYSISVSFTGVETYTQTIDNIVIGEPTLLLASIIDFANAVCGQAQGSATVTATGGTSGYSYQWSGTDNNQTTQTAENLVGGIHNVVVTDAKGCTATTSIQLSDPDGPILTQIGSTPVPCHNSTDGGSATLSVSGGTAPFDVYWPELDLHDSVAVNIAPGYYQATVTDATGCTYPLQNIFVPAPEELSAILTNFNDPACFNDANGEITIAGNGGTEPYQYQWQNITDNPTTATVSGLEAGSYEVLITDANNCTATESIPLNNPEEIIINLPDSVFICQGQTATLDAGNMGSLFEWVSENGFTSDHQIINVQEQGDYVVQVSNVQGCSNSSKVHVKYENRQFYATFLMAGEATLNDTIIVIELSRPQPDSVQWYITDDFMRLTDGDAYKELLPLEVGEYTVGMKAYYAGCSEMVEKRISIIPADNSKTEKLAVAELIQNAKLFPNPNTGAFEVEVKLAKEANISADVFSMKGMRVMPTKFDYGKKEYLLGFNLMQLEPGIYFVNIIVEKEVRKLKFIVN